MAPTISAGVMAAKVSWKMTKVSSGMTTPAEKVAVAAAHADWSVPALCVFLGSYLVLAALTWAVYLRPGARLRV